MTGHSHNRRHTIVVNKPMQSRLILNMALLPAMALAAIAVLTAVYCSRLMEEAVAIDAELPNLMPLFYLVVAFELLAAMFLMFNSLKISHRVAGPAYRICKSLERIRTGDLAFTVNLREGDHLTEIRDELNLLLDWLNQNPPPGCVTRAMAPAKQDGQPDQPQDGPQQGGAPPADGTIAVTTGGTARALDAAAAGIKVAATTARDDDAS